jgi:hypothetical protein
MRSSDETLKTLTHVMKHHPNSYKHLLRLVALWFVGVFSHRGSGRVFGAHLGYARYAGDWFGEMINSGIDLSTGQKMVDTGNKGKTGEWKR